MKTLEDLKKSRAVRKQIIDKYGDVPKSVWDISYKKTGVYDFRKTQDEIADAKHKKMNYDKQFFNAFSSSGKSVRGKGGGLSVFPPKLVYDVVNFYTNEGDIVLDPSSGHNSRMQIVHQMRRHYIGYDVSRTFMQFNMDIAKKIKSQKGFIKNDSDIVLHEQSSEKMIEKDNSVDLCFTSPPYWDTEYYGDEDDQLGSTKTYDDFMQRLTLIIGECKRVLTHEGFCVFNVNDFQKNGVYYPFHADVIKAYQSVGLSIWDVIIIKWANSLAACFASQVEDRKKTAKIHEYLIVGRKK